MLNNNHKNSTCDNAEPLISYLYGEINESEKAGFEAHLKNCASCSDELTEFGFARSAIREWRVETFDKLATPIFEIPAKASKTQAMPTNWRSRFSDWRRIFSFQPALAMSALAIAVVLCGVTFLAFNYQSGNEIAGKTAGEKISETAVSPTIEKIIIQPKQTGDDNADKFITFPKDLPVKTVNKKTDVQKSSAVKDSANAPKDNSGDVVPVKVVQKINKGNQKSPVAQQTKVPRLTDAEDVEDDSVRLTDLFDEIGAK